MPHDALDKLIGDSFPRDTLALYGRWAQLEGWLRELVYTELRARQGSGWEQAIDRRTASRSDRDEINGYMASADRSDLLSYLDVGLLFQLIDDNWELFEACLLPRVRWLGLAHELLAIRHRIAHVRRPHRDDLARVEQALRDLDHGARVFYAAYAQERRFGNTGAVATGWRRGGHPTAERLMEHAARQYGTRFTLRASARPWAPDAKAHLGDAGSLWHAQWMQVGSGEADPVEFWEGLGSLRGEAGRDAQKLAMHVLWSGPGSLEITFPAVEDQRAIADAIGQCFDVLLMQTRRTSVAQIDGEAWQRWTAKGDLLPGRVQVGSLLSLAAPDMPFRVLEP